MTDDTQTHRMVVHDSFVIRGLGVILQPSLPTDAFEHGARLSLVMLSPDGAERVVEARFYIEHLNLGRQRSKWDGVIVLDDGSEKVIAGTEVTVRSTGIG